MADTTAPRFVLMEDADGDPVVVDTYAGLAYGFIRAAVDEPHEVADLLARANGNPANFATIYHALPVEQIEGLHDPEVSE